MLNLEKLTNKDDLWWLTKNSENPKTISSHQIASNIIVLEVYTKKTEFRDFGGVRFFLRYRVRKCFCHPQGNAYKWCLSSTETVSYTHLTLPTTPYV